MALSLNSQMILNILLSILYSAYVDSVRVHSKIHGLLLYTIFLNLEGIQNRLNNFRMNELRINSD